MISGDGLNLLFRMRGDSSSAKKASAQLRDQMSADMKAISENTTLANTSLSQFFGNLASSALSNFTSTVVDAGKALLDYSARMEQTKIGFETLMGGAAQAQKHLEELKKFAVETPFEFEGLAKMSRRLQNVGVDAAKVIPLMRDIGNAASAAGASAEDLDGIVLAFSQIIAKGKVSAEEVNQLAERGIPVWKMLSEQLGKSKAEIMKLSEQGAISSEVFTQVFQQFSQAKFGDAMQKQSQTFYGAMSTIKDIAMQTGETAFAPFFNKISSFTVDFSNSLQSQEAGARTAGQKFAFAIGEAMGKSYAEGMAKGGGRWFAGGAGTSTPGGSFAGILTSILTDAALGASAGFVKGNEKLDLNKTVKLDNDVLMRFNSLNNTFIQMPRYIRQGKVELDQLNNTVRFVAESVKAVNPLDAQLKAAQAKEEAETLAKIITDLTTKITFFGQESEVAALKQKLISEGIRNFESDAVKAALALAATLDKLKAVQKAQEDYNKKFKEWTDKMSDFRTNAFSSMFPPQSDLDRFNQWVRATKADMSDLKDEVALTRYFLEQTTRLKDLFDARARSEDFRSTIDSSIKEILLGKMELSNLEQSLYGIAKAANLASTNFRYMSEMGAKLGLSTNDALDKTEEVFAKTVASFNTQMRLLEQNFAAASAELDRQIDAAADGEKDVLFKAQDELRAKFVEQEKKLTDALKAYLRTLKTFDKDGKEVFLFPSETEVEAAIQKLYALDGALRQVAEGAREMNRALRSSISGEDPEGNTKDEHTRKKRFPADAAPGNRDDVQTGFFEKMLESFGKYIEGIAAVRDANGELQFSFETVFTKIRDLGLEAFSQLTSGFGTMVSNWVLYGDEAGNSLRKMTAQVLANLAATATQYALMCLAAAALASTAWGAAILGGTPAQFLAGAAAFGAVAVGAAVAGRLIAGDSFKKQQSGAFGESSERRSGSGGEVYSSNRDAQILNMSRNAAASIPQQSLVIESKGGLSFDELFVIRYQSNRRGGIRDIIRRDND